MVAVFQEESPKRQISKARATERVASRERLPFFRAFALSRFRDKNTIGLPL
jgi:hypothetical protein